MVIVSDTSILSNFFRIGQFILLKAKQSGHITLIRPLMDDLMSIAKAFIAPKLFADVLVLAGE